MLRFFLIIFLFLFSYSYAQVSVDFPRKIGIGDLLVLTISIENSEKISIESEDFELLGQTGSSFIKTIINGKISSKKVVTYNFRPTKKGSLVFNITIDGKDHQYRVRVVDGKLFTAKPRKQILSNPLANFNSLQQKIEKDSIIIENQISKRKMFINEIAVLETIIYRRVPIENLSLQKDFSKQCYNLIRVDNFDKKLKNVRLNNKVYRKEVIMKHLIYPYNTGKCEIKDLTFRAHFFSSRFLDIPVKKINFEVMSYPTKDQPMNFNNQFGDFSIKTEISKRIMEQNEPISLSVIISGTGNFNTLLEPHFQKQALAGNQVEIKKGKILDRFNVNGNNLVGEKIYEYYIIPYKQGNTFLPPVTLSFYSPKKKRFVTLKKDLPTLDVKKNTDLSTTHPIVSPKTQDILYIQPKLSNIISPLWTYHLIGSFSLLFFLLVLNPQKVKKPFRLLYQLNKKGKIKTILKGLNKISHQDDNNNSELNKWVAIKNELLQFLIEYFNLDKQLKPKAILKEVSQLSVESNPSKDKKINQKTINIDALKSLLQKVIDYEEYIYSFNNTSTKLILAEEIDQLKKLLKELHKK